MTKILLVGVLLIFECVNLIFTLLKQYISRINKPLIKKTKAPIDLVKQSSSIFGFILLEVRPIPKREQVRRQ